MIRSKQFTEDNEFLIEPFLNIISNLPDEFIIEAKENGSYYNFFIETSNFIIVPKMYNFVFKYLKYMKEHSPAYVAKLETSLLNYGIDLSNLDFDNINNIFDLILDCDMYNVLPKIILDDDYFIYYENVLETEDMSLIQFAKRYSKIIDFAKDNSIKNQDIYMFPNPIQDYYVIKKDRLVLKYPIWNAFRWSFELPKFVTNFNNDIFKFKKFDSEDDQKSILLMLDNYEHIINKVKG